MSQLNSAGNRLEGMAQRPRKPQTPHRGSAGAPKNTVRPTGASSRNEALSRSAAARARSGTRKPPTSKPVTSSYSASRAPRTSADTEVLKSRFSNERHIVFQGENGTRRISLRLAVVVVFAIIAILIISNPLTQYLEQKESIRQAKADLVAVQQRVEDLESELALWKDPVYIQAQARERLGYVMPGQTLYQVIDPAEGTAAEQLEDRTAEVERQRRESTPFYVTAWDSIAVAGQAGVLENPSNVPVIGEQPAPSAKANPSATPSPSDSGQPTEIQTTTP